MLGFPRLYCHRKFDSNRGLSLHLPHCKNRQIFDTNHLSHCRITIEPLSDVQVVSNGENEIVLSPAELNCCPDGCNSVDALTGPVNHHSTESRANNDAELKAISNLPAFISNGLVSVSSRL